MDFEKYVKQKIECSELQETYQIPFFGEAELYLNADGKYFVNNRKLGLIEFPYSRSGKRMKEESYNVAETKLEIALNQIQTLKNIEGGNK